MRKRAERAEARVKELELHLASVIETVDELTVSEPTNRSNVEEARAVLDGGKP